MITILIVDDDESKQRRISEVLLNALGKDNVTFQLARSVAEAANELESKDFDLLVLDVNLPLQNDSSPKQDGGIRLLQKLVRGGPRLRRPQHIVGLTAYDELLTAFEENFQSESWQLLKYEYDSTAWEDVLSRRATYISGTVEQNKINVRFKTDLAIVTALKEIELEAILNLPADWKVKQLEGDDTFYHSGHFKNGNKSLSVICAAAIEMGMSAAACMTQKIIHNFRPKYLAMAGITAGINAKFGDVIIADQSWDYGSGKMTSEENHESIFRPAPNYIAIDAELKEKVQFFAQSRRNEINKIRDDWNGYPSETPLDVRIGPMASGAAVLESKEAIESIKHHNRKVIAVEMEAYGVSLACRTATAPRPKCFCAKSVCDFGSPPKTDAYQRYAAYTSASFIYEFALDQLATGTE